MKTRCLLRPDIIRVLAAWMGKEDLSQMKASLPFASLLLSFEDSDFTAEFLNGQNSVQIFLKYQGETMLVARLTRITTAWGRKIYAEYSAGITEYEKKKLADTLKFVVACALMLGHAYECESTTPPAVFIIGKDTKTEDDILIVKAFANPPARERAKTHKSPEMPFGVRGHYRHLRSGKVVWVKAYRKGEK